MSGIKNKKSGIVHVAKEGYAHLGLCGADIHSFITLDDSHKVTCKNCLRILKNREKEKKRTCKYPGCISYSNNAKTYCCNACSADAYDDERLSEEEQEMEKLRGKIVKDLKARIKDHHVNFPVKLEKKALELLKDFIEKEANIYETTNLSTIITEVLEKYCGYLKKYHLN